MKRPSLKSRGTPALLAFAAVTVLWPAGAGAQLDRKYYRSVLKVSCDLPDGSTLKSTGFVWRDSKTVVTALHGVAGCTRIIVTSETLNGQSRAATLARANQEADLGLLALEQAFDLAPLAHATAEPPMAGARYTVVGYPRQTQKLGAYGIEFIDGERGGMITLQEAFGTVDGQRDLFKDVKFPRTSASIFRVLTVLQSGQSGAPILDMQGRVVGIVDGGLLGGTLGLNWSIAAHRYLPDLSNAPGPIPTQPSKWTALMSSLEPAGPTKAIVLPERRQTAVALPAGGALTRVRSMSLAQFEALLRSKGQTDSNIAFIRGEVGPEAFKRLSFDVYEDPLTGATFGVPSTVQLAWNPALRAIDAVSASGKVRLILGVLEGQSFEDATVTARQAFLGKVLNLANWQTSPATMKFKNFEPKFEYANNASYFYGADRTSGLPTKVNLSLTVSGRQLLGYAIYGPKDIGKDLSTDDLAMYLMVQMGAQELSGFARQ